MLLLKSNDMNNMVPVILVVDDDSANLKVVGQLLKEYEFRVEFARSGMNAIELLSEIKPDLILLDVMMPEMNGFETCEHIKKMPEYAGIPILFLSALNEVNEMVRGLNCGALDFILKPFSAPLLLSKINLHLDLKRKTEAIENMNAILELQVAERTAELEKANQELIQLDETKAEFLRIISHEIRTPLNGILGFSALIKNTNSGEDIEKYTFYLDRAVKRLERFSINALNYTILRTGKYDINLQTLQLNDLIINAMKDLEQVIKDKPVSFDIKVDQVCIQADSEFAIDCIKSIIDNAVKFSDPDSSVSIIADAQSDGVWVKVIDNGQGFSQKAMDKLFTPFSPGDIFINENEGLELALCRLIMDMHKGQIKVYNLKKGASVDLFFPNAVSR
jgi:two-component system sensor histidine kinase/response regulator